MDEGAEAEEMEDMGLSLIHILLLCIGCGRSPSVRARSSDRPADAKKKRPEGVGGCAVFRKPFYRCFSSLYRSAYASHTGGGPFGDDQREPDGRSHSDG